MMKLQNQPLYQLMVRLEFPYPFISRDNRLIYKKYPFTDPYYLWVSCCCSAVVGHWVGKLAGKRQIIYPFVFCLPVMVAFVAYEKIVAGKVNSFKENMVEIIVQEPKKVKKHKEINLKGFHSNIKLKQFPNLDQSSIDSPQILISNLPSSYYV